MKVELSLHASNLGNVAGLCKGTSDPFAVVTHVATAKGSKSAVIGKTEIIKNTLSPQWTKIFMVNYELGTPMKVVVSVFDEVRKGDNKSMGSAVFDIGELLGARGNTKAKKVRNSGTIFAHVQKSEGAGLLRLKMSGIKLKNTEGFLKKSDPFFELSRSSNAAIGRSWDNIYRSDTVNDNLSPVWNDAVVELSVLCSGEQDKPVLVTVYDFESSGKHVLMGQFETSVTGLVAAAKNNTQITLKKKGKETGTIIVKRADVSGVKDVTEKMAAATVSTPVPAVTSTYVPTPASTFIPTPLKPSFIDYVSGGCELNVGVAIDFTGSNGDPRLPGTLHHLTKDGTNQNPYEKAISAILGVLQNYDSDKKFPVWGFGAKYGGVVRHCFQCGPTAEANGVDGVFAAYHHTFQSGFVMSRPTVITEVMKTAAVRATSAQEAALQKGQQAYTILVILTDGAVSDVNATAACMEEISDAPLSVVIVGVGDADFSGMHFLDNASKPGKRDIAQFVEFNKHSGSSVSLSSETLSEIPEQLVGYFQSKGIEPLPPVSRKDDEIEAEEEEEEIDLSLNFGEEDEIVISGGDDFVSGW